MWLFTAPNTDRIFHAGPSKRAHWIDVTGSGKVIESEVRSVDQMCGSAVM
jgi:galactose oxidase